MTKGDGFYWRVPDGFNPFYAGAMAIARASEKVRCWRCEGTGRAIVAHGESSPEDK